MCVLKVGKKVRTLSASSVSKLRRAEVKHTVMYWKM